MNLFDIFESNEQDLDEDLRKWFKDKWVRFGPDGEIRGDCARGDDSEGKPKCLPQSKAQSLGKKGRASAAARKRREDPNPERSGKAINVATKKKSNEGVAEAINPDITNPEFSHQQQIGDYLYVARYWSKGLKITAYHGNKQIGYAELMYQSAPFDDFADPKTTPKRIWLESEWTRVDPKYQRQGIMSTMYAYAKMLGNSVKPSQTRSDDAKAAWKSWRQSGDAKHLTSESDDPWGPQGNFAGDKHVDVGGVTMKIIQVGDIVKYLGQKAEVVALSKDRKRARITIQKGMGGITKDVNTSDLNQFGQGVEEGLAQDESEQSHGWVADSIDEINYNTFEVHLTNTRSGESADLVIRPVDMMRISGKLQIETIDVRDLATGDTQSWTTEMPDPQGAIVDAIDALFWDNPQLNKKLYAIIDAHSKKGQDMLPGQKNRAKVGMAAPADQFIAGQDAIAKAKGTVKEFDAQGFQQRYTLYKDGYEIEKFGDMDDAIEYAEDDRRDGDDPLAVYKIVDINKQVVWDSNPYEKPSRIQLRKPEQGVAEAVHPDVVSKEYFNDPTRNVRMGDFEFNARTFTGAMADPNARGLQIRAYDPKRPKGQNLVGSSDFIVKSDKKGNQWLESDDVEVNDEYRSKGVATMMYAFAKSLGNDIKASPYQSKAGSDMWKKWGSDAKYLVGEQGVAEGLENFLPNDVKIAINFNSKDPVAGLGKIWEIVQDGKIRFYLSNGHRDALNKLLSKPIASKEDWNLLKKQMKNVLVRQQGVAEGVNDTVYPNAEVIKSKNGRPVGEIYQDGNSWGCFHYRADRGYDMIDSREDAIQALKDLHAETGRSGPDYTFKGVAEGSTDDPRFQKMMGNIQQSTPNPVGGYVAVSYASERPSKKIKGVTYNGKPMPSTVDPEGFASSKIKFTPDQIEAKLAGIGQKYGWDSIDPGHGQGYDELYFDTSTKYTSATQRKLATNIVKTVNEINKFFNDINRSLQATGLPGYKVNVWQGMGENGNINQYEDLSHITNIAKGQTAKPDAGPAIGKMILKHLPSYEAEKDELGYDSQDFQDARNIANIYITKGERAGLQAQHDYDEVSDMIDELLSDAGGDDLRTIWDLDEQGVAEGSEWETRHDEFVTVGDRATPEQINKIVSALGVAAKQASSKRGFLNQIVGKQSNGDLARMAHGAETLAKNIQRNRNAKLGTDERKELGQHLVYAVSLLKRISGEHGVEEAQLDEKCWDTHRQAGMKKKGNRMVPNCVPKESIEEMAGKTNPDAVRRIQQLLNKKFDANLDIDGILGPLTLKSIKKFLPKSSEKQAPNPEKTTAVQGKQVKEEKCPHCGGEMVSEELINEKKDSCYYKVKSRYKVWPSAYASGALVKCRKKGAKNWGNKSEDVAEGLNEMDKTQTPPGRDGDIDWTKKQIHLGPEHTMKAKDVAKHALKILNKTMKKSHADTPKKKGVAEEQLDEKWSQKYKDSINCSNPKGFSQKAHCAGEKKNEDIVEGKEYYTVTGTDSVSLRRDFNMAKDRNGWYLKEGATPKQKLEAFRAFGSPKLKEFNLAAFSGGTQTKGEDNVISPVGSQTRAQYKK